MFAQTVITSRLGAWLPAAAALALLALGVWLAHRIEPDVAVETLLVAEATPVLHVYPAAPAPPGKPYPVALLGHGVTASKETMFRLSEALAAAGWDCYAVDFPGHGASRYAFLLDDMPMALEEVAVGAQHVEAYVGHSMGAYVGAQWYCAINHAGHGDVEAFIALGAVPPGNFLLLDDFGPRVTLLFGQYDEAFPVAKLPRHGAMTCTISPWSDHALEPYDPVLVQTAVVAAARGPAAESEATVRVSRQHELAVARPVPEPTERWVGRLLGVVLAVGAALMLAEHLPTLFPHLVRGRGVVIAILLLATLSATATTWIGSAPVLRRVPLQLALMVLIAACLWLAAKLRVRRWSYALMTGLLALLCLLCHQPFLALFAVLFTLLLAVGALLGWLASRRGGHPREGDYAFAIFLGYALGQWVPLLW